MAKTKIKPKKITPAKMSAEDFSNLTKRLAELEAAQAKPVIVNPAALAPVNPDDKNPTSLLPPGTIVPPVPTDAVRIDLGCGKNKAPGFKGLDIAAIEGVDFVHDLSVSPWPFEAESVHEFRACHVLEHFWGEDQMEIMNEAYRCLKFDGTFTIIVPAWNSVRQWQDPTHKSPFPDAKALYFNKGWRDTNGLSHYPITADFDIPTTNYSIVDPDPSTGIQGYVNKVREVQMNAMYYMNNVVSDITMVFRKVKRA